MQKGIPQPFGGAQAKTQSSILYFNFWYYALYPAGGTWLLVSNNCGKQKHTTQDTGGHVRFYNKLRLLSLVSLVVMQSLMEWAPQEISKSAWWIKSHLQIYLDNQKSSILGAVLDWWI